MTTEQLNSLVIGKSIFSKNGNTYRLTAFLYVYKTVDGDMKRAYVDRENANAVSGTGVCGCICDIDDIIISDETIEHDRFINKERYTKQINDDKSFYEFLLSLEPNLTEEEFEDKLIDSIMGDYEK